MSNKGKKANIVFVTTMHRYGDYGKHSYVLGVFSNETLAKLHGDTEHLWRGNKYDPVVTKWEIDKEPAI